MVFSCSSPRADRRASPPRLAPRLRRRSITSSAFSGRDIEAYVAKERAAYDAATKDHQLGPSKETEKALAQAKAAWDAKILDALKKHRWPKEMYIAEARTTKIEAVPED